MKYINESDANMILNNIWLGNKYAACDINFITRYKICRIINVTYDVFNKYDFIDYYVYPLNNDLSHSKLFVQVMDKCSNIIYDSVCKNIPIYIHCKRGHHRSACVLAFFLMKYYQMSLNDAVRIIKTLRTTTFRKNNYMFKSLMQLDKIKYFG
ncbi:dual specificity phosphatase [Acanthamoeba polyphaga mimivirus]|uniref:Dual specificity phosphatase n=4 Tax=Megamimivirinae TaxID=3044648 RepID=A0A2L2DIU0_MIMIV|nr:dual specificity phosphatase [Megavirus courdo11]AGD92255.1 dual specificity phosphatase [Megavirus lba]AUV58292.1 dual specificity phosphatase [Bandra megavirus]AVG46081.1 dual specificity phosphatase [Acanthamoeba polyphaga mimivirus]